jgi:DNA-binding MarR family transcriptional regulator
MKKDFPYSKNIILLVRLMEPNTPYFPFDLRGVLGADHSKTSQVERTAEDYGLVRSEPVSGRIHRYVLTEKGCRYHDELMKATDEEFIKSLKKEPRITSDIKDLAERLGIRPNVKFTITPKGENYFTEIVKGHHHYSRFSDAFSKNRGKQFRKEADTILVLKIFEKRKVASLSDVVSEVKRNNRESRIISYKYTLLPLVDEGYLQPVCNER